MHNGLGETNQKFSEIDRVGEREERAETANNATAAVTPHGVRRSSKKELYIKVHLRFQ